MIQVGAVAIDIHGNIAAATSTGGIPAKMAGRVGDSPLIGCGAFADNFVGGVSTTGHGVCPMILVNWQFCVIFLPGKLFSPSIFEIV